MLIACVLLATLHTLRQPQHALKVKRKRKSSSLSGQGFPVWLTALKGWLISRVLKPAGQLAWRHWSTLNYVQLQPTWLICPLQMISARVLSDLSFFFLKYKKWLWHHLYLYSKQDHKSASFHCFIVCWLEITGRCWGSAGILEIWAPEHIIYTDRACKSDNSVIKKNTLLIPPTVV